MLEQFTREFLQLYPGADLLIAGKDDTSRDRRARFVARVATGDWDAVIITHQGFGQLPVHPDVATDHIRVRLNELRDITAGVGLGTRAVKRLERRVKTLEATLERLVDQAGHDPGATFEHTGIDYLFIDEAHYFKNRQLATNITGVGTVASKRAEDLACKTGWLAARYPDRGSVTFATGTPVANSIAEMFTMQSYLQPARLAELNIHQFDAWAANFATTVTALELAPDGGSYRMATRFARFRNVPDLVGIYREVADVKRGAELNLTRPALVGGQVRTITTAASPELAHYVTTLVERAEQIRQRTVRPDEDNMLAVTGDGRRAALDLRLVDQPPGSTPGKIDACADEVTAIYHRYRHDRYHDPGTGREHPRPGALQVVFCDIGTPGGTRWGVYEHLRHLLTERGVPAGMVRFVHEAGNTDAKARLFAQARDGQIAVLIGSTDKMGVGTNVQDRLVALHHLDAPWRPADIEQRDGRILRPGNQHREVHINRYVTTGSFDVYLWQTLERKAGFIGQLLANTTGARTIDDLADITALSYGEVKALATGNPLILEHATVETDLARHQRLAAGWRTEHATITAKITTTTERIERLDQQINRVDDAVARRVTTRGDHFHATIDGTAHHDRSDTGDALRTTVDRGPHSDGPIGTVGGFAFTARIDRDEITITFDHDAIDPVRWPLQEWATTAGLSIVRRLEHALDRLDSHRDHLDLERGRDQRELVNARQHAHDTNPHTATITELTARLAALTGQLTASLTPTEPDPTTPHTTVASTTVASTGVGSDRVAADIAVLVAQLPSPTADPTIDIGHQHRGLGPVDPLP